MRAVVERRFRRGRPRGRCRGSRLAIDAGVESWCWGFIGAEFGQESNTVDRAPRLVNSYRAGARWRRRRSLRGFDGASFGRVLLRRGDTSHLVAEVLLRPAFDDVHQVPKAAAVDQRLQSRVGEAQVAVVDQAARGRCMRHVLVGRSSMYRAEQRIAGARCGGGIGTNRSRNRQNAVDTLRRLTTRGRSHEVGPRALERGGGNARRRCLRCGGSGDRTDRC